MCRFFRYVACLAVGLLPCPMIMLKEDYLQQNTGHNIQMAVPHGTQVNHSVDENAPFVFSLHVAV